MAKPNWQLDRQGVPGRGQLSLPPKIPSPVLPSNSNQMDKQQVDLPRPCSTDVQSEEAPSWLEDLLNEPESPANRSHRRSASDTFAYLAATTSENELWFRSITGGGPYWMPQPVSNRRPNPTHHQQDKLRKLSSRSPPLPNDIIRAREDADMSALGMYYSTPEPDRDTSTANETQNQADSAHTSDGSDCSQSQMKPASGKRKQHNARRSRVRKLQYIAELERNAQALQLEGVEVAAQLEFLDQQNLILAMENRALKQRLENLSQEQCIKSMEQEILDRELARLQYTYHVQNTNHHQQRQRQKQIAAHHRGRSYVDSEFAKLQLHPPDTVAESNGFRELQRN